MVESMVERVARAICDSANGEHGCGGFCQAVVNYGDAARAAIEAMREPTRDMIARGSWHRDNERLFWQAMIDTALNEQVVG